MGSTSNNWIKTHKLSLVDENTNIEYDLQIDNNNLCIKHNNETNLEIDSNKKTITNNIFNIKHQSTDPDKPSNNNSIIWLSNGDGIGNSGDLMIASTVNNETRYGRLFDFNSASVWF